MPLLLHCFLKMDEMLKFSDPSESISLLASLLYFLCCLSLDSCTERKCEKREIHCCRRFPDWFSATQLLDASATSTALLQHQFNWKDVNRCEGVVHWQPWGFTWSFTINRSVLHMCSLEMLIHNFLSLQALHNRGITHTGDVPTLSEQTSSHDCGHAHTAW